VLRMTTSICLLLAAAICAVCAIVSLTHGVPLMLAAGALALAAVAVADETGRAR